MEIYDDMHIIQEEWSMVKRILKVTATVIKREKTTTETRYYISDLEVDAKTFLAIVRSHWAIENCPDCKEEMPLGALHYVKDVAFLEDFNRMRTSQIPTVTSLLRALAINLLNLNGFPNKTQARKMFAWGIKDIFSLDGV